jgi:uroporphyrinogen-III synthase
MNHTARTLLWFRPLSPLRYALPESLLQKAWAGTQHIPIDQLQACHVSEGDAAVLQAVPTWVLSSPTAAYLAAHLGRPNSIAVMGKPTQQAWRDAGGVEPNYWLISPTGESMGLDLELRQHANICVLRGKLGRNDLIESLTAHGVSVSTVAVYEKKQHPQFATDLNAALNHSPVALYLSSTDQAARVLAVVQDPATLLASPLIVSHKRIATAAHDLGFKTVVQNN